jgi:hypothetical protein
MRVLEAIRDSLLTLIFSGWFLVCLLGQERPSGVLKSRWFDFNGLLPNYRFFAPIPMMRDQRLEYRVFESDNLDHDWSLLMPLQNWRYRWLFNPTQRLQKGLVDMCLLLLRTKFPKGGFYLPYPYLLVLSTAIEAVGHIDSGKFQFRIVQDSGYEIGEPLVVFISYVHDLPLQRFR